MLAISSICMLTVTNQVLGIGTLLYLSKEHGVTSRNSAAPNYVTHLIVWSVTNVTRYPLLSPPAARSTLHKQPFWRRRGRWQSSSLHIIASSYGHPPGDLSLTWQRFQRRRRQRFRDTSLGRKGARRQPRAVRTDSEPSQRGSSYWYASGCNGRTTITKIVAQPSPPGLHGWLCIRLIKHMTLLHKIRR